VRLAEAAQAEAAQAGTRNFTVYGPTIELRYGEVYHPPASTLPLPADIVEAFSGNNTPLVISAYELDLVKVGGTGEEERVPLYDLYNHHYKLALGIDDNHTDDFQVRPRLHPHP
jgi:hypothetical protein